MLAGHAALHNSFCRIVLGLHRAGCGSNRFLMVALFARAQVVMAFLVGMGDEEPLRYRILPISQFMNLGQSWHGVPRLC